MKNDGLKETKVEYNDATKKFIEVKAYQGQEELSVITCIEKASNICLSASDQKKFTGNIEIKIQKCSGANCADPKDITKFIDALSFVSQDQSHQPYVDLKGKLLTTSGGFKVALSS
jgi:hypothetical protein